jgi:CRP-like cAMP-binding protein
MPSADFRGGNMLSVDPDSTLGRVLNFLGQHLRVDKIFLDLGLDPNHFTYDAVIHRVMEAAIANINIANVLALVGAAFYVATLMMRTIVPLRIIGIISITFFIAYGVVAGAVSTFLLYLLSLPINVIRLRQMLSLVKKARMSAQGDLSMDWLRPYMTPRKYRKGDVLFRKGDVANEMFLTVTGKFLVSEIGIEVPPGRIMGELGFVAPKNKRTQTVNCVESGDVLTITYETLLELYFQNPEFGYYLLSLTSERLLQNVSRLEGLVEEYKTKLDQEQMRRPSTPVAAPR